MKCNEETVLIGQKVVLVPYRKEHVEKYHEWMLDEDIRQQTASEPLSIEEEYAMQKSWHVDPDKLTFIVLARDDPSSTVGYKSAADAIAHSKMAGDVNIFLSEYDDPSDDEQDKSTHTSRRHEAELEVMIAETNQRRRGLAREALGLMMNYVTCRKNDCGAVSVHSIPQVPFHAFVAKVGIENQASIAMFNSLGFHEVHRSTIWKEAEMRPTNIEDERFQAGVKTAPLQTLQWLLDDV